MNPASRLIAIIALAGSIHALCGEDPPQWVLAGIAAVETGSHYRADGSIDYHDRRDGSRGEVGVFQLCPIALRDIRLLAMRDEIRHDPVAAEFAAILYLRRCFQHTGSWWRAVGLYHSRDPDEAAAYARRVFAFRPY